MMLVFKPTNSSRTPFKLKFQLKMAKKENNQVKEMLDITNIQLPRQDLYFSYNGKHDYQMGFIFQKKNPFKPWVDSGYELHVVKVKESLGEGHEDRGTFHYPFKTREMKR